MLKKTVHALVQLLFFFFMSMKAGGQIKARVIECGWPNSRWKSRFLIIGSLCLDDSQILTMVDGKLFTLNGSPQYEFFKGLDTGRNLSEIYYFQIAKRTLNDENFDFWLQTKTKLWKEFNVEDEEFTPVGILTFNRGLIVEDGAHRLALRSLRGHTRHRVAVSLWSFT